MQMTQLKKLIKFLNIQPNVSKQTKNALPTLKAEQLNKMLTLHLGIKIYFVMTKNLYSNFANLRPHLISAKSVGKLLARVRHWQTTKEEIMGQKS